MLYKIYSMFCQPRPKPSSSFRYYFLDWSLYFYDLSCLKGICVLDFQLPRNIKTHAASWNYIKTLNNSNLKYSYVYQLFVNFQVPKSLLMTDNAQKIDFWISEVKMQTFPKKYKTICWFHINPYQDCGGGGC